MHIAIIWILERIFYNLNKGEKNMDYKKLIIEMLDQLDKRRSRLVYVYIKALLGLDK